MAPARLRLFLLTVLLALSVMCIAPQNVTAETSVVAQHPLGNLDPSDDWPTYHRDLSRSGYDPAIPQFTSVSLNWKSATLDGDVYAEPLIVGTDVIVATESNSLYELNAANGQTVWHINLGTPVNGGLLPCGDINPSGITGTPVIDVAGRTIFVVAFLQATDGTLHHELFAIDLDTGTVRFQRPIDPQGANATIQQQRAALALSNGYVYVAYGGLDGDCGPYHGWLVASSTNGGGPVISYQVPTGRAGAIWGGGDGPAVDNSGDLLVATGNSDATSSFDFGDSVMKLSPATSPPISVLDWFAPSNWAQLNAADLDLGSTDPVILSSQFLFQIGKEGMGYLLNAAKLGGIGGQLYSSQVCTSGHGVYGGLAYASPYLMVPCDNGLVALKVNLGSNPSFSIVWRGPNYLAGPPIIAGNAVWDVDAGGGVIYAFSLSSGQTLFQDTIGSVPTHFNSLSAGDGQIFVSASRQLLAYLPQPVSVSSLGSVLLNAPAGTVYFIFPDSNTSHPKPTKLGVGYAQVTDWTALGYVYGSLANMPQVTALDTNTTYVDPTTGAPRIHNSVIVLFGGRLVNTLVADYDQNGISPLTWKLVGGFGPSGVEYYYTRSGQVAATITVGTIAAGSQDMPLIEAFKDLFNNTVIIFSGFGWKGTFVSGLFFKTFLESNLSTLSDSWYFWNWQDLNNNGFADWYEVNQVPVNHGN